MVELHYNKMVELHYNKTQIKDLDWIRILTFIYHSAHTIHQQQNKIRQLNIPV